MLTVIVAACVAAAKQKQLIKINFRACLKTRSGGRRACRRGRASRRPEPPSAFSETLKYFNGVAACVRFIRRARRHGSTAGGTPAATTTPLGVAVFKQALRKRFTVNNILHLNLKEFYGHLRVNVAKIPFAT